MTKNKSCNNNACEDANAAFFLSKIDCTLTKALIENNYVFHLERRHIFKGNSSFSKSKKPLTVHRRKNYVIIYFKHICI